jgi:hypothetical protein
MVSRQAHVRRGMRQLNGKPRASLHGVVPVIASAGTATRPARGGRGVKVIREVSLALAVYGMAGWVYVGLCALAAPQTLALPLTHLVPSLREDTAGVLSFIVSFLGFISYRITRRN